MPAALICFFEESGYPLPFRTTGCPAAAAAALVARHALIILKIEADIIGFLSSFGLHNTSIGTCHEKI